MNEVIETILKRRSCRSYEAEVPYKEELDAIIEAGRFAPSGGNNQKSHLIVFSKKKDLEVIKSAVREGFRKLSVYDGMYPSLKNAVIKSESDDYDFIYNAPVLIVVANEKGYGNAMADSACLLENMMIAAASLNIGSCWINQLHWLDEDEDINRLMKSYGLLENETICGALSLGYPKTMSKGILERKGNSVTYV